MPAKKKSAPGPAVQPIVASVAVVVKDRARATEWYSKTLGLDVVDRMDHWVTVGRKGRPGVLHLCQTTEFDPNGQLEPGNTGIALLLPGKDFVASCAALKSRGVPFVTEPEKADWGWWATIRDPDGNEFILGPEQP